MIDIHTILNENGPMLSSEIKEILLKTSSINDAAARQQISRAKGVVQKLKSFTFPKNEAFLFLKHQYKTNMFYQNLYKALLKTGSTTGNVLSALSCLSGSVKIEKFNCFAGSVHGIKRKTIDTVKKELLFVDFIEEIITSPDNHKIILKESLSPKVELSESVIEIVEEVLVAVIQDWLRKNSFGSYNTITQYTDYGGFNWDLTAPTYLLPFVDKKDSTVYPGFVVVDILPQINIHEDHVRYIIAKVNCLAVKKNLRPFLPMVIGLHFSSKSFEMLKKEGILVTTVANLIGEESAKLLYSIIDVINNANNKITESNDEQITKILKAVAKYEGKFNNLKGHLFEMVAGNIMFSTTRCFIEMNRKIHHNGIRLAEIDVFCVVGKTEIIVIECKAYNSQIDENMIKEWKSKIAIIYNWLKENQDNNDKIIRFEYWSSSGFTEEAIAILSEYSNAIKKYKICWHDYNTILDMCIKEKLTSQVEIIKEYYNTRT